MSIRVLASVIARADRFLVGRRPAHKRHGGLWEFPGGKVEAGESDLAAVRRELAEELAVRVREVGEVAFSVRDPGSEFVIHFLPVEIEGEPRSIEHDELRWASVRELRALPLAPSDHRFVREGLEAGSAPALPRGQGAPTLRGESRGGLPPDHDPPDHDPPDTDRSS